MIDEGHRIKNEKSLLSINVRTVPCKLRLLLTGTPLQNNLRELWSLLHFLLPDVFTVASSAKFEDAFDLAKGKCDTDMLRKAHQLLQPLMIMRKKCNVAVTLPPKTEIKLRVPMCALQRMWYSRLLKRLSFDTLMELGNNVAGEDQKAKGSNHKLFHSHRTILELSLLLLHCSELKSLIVDLKNFHK